MTDLETMAVNALKEEGAFLHQAELDAERLTRRLAEHSARTIRLDAEELRGLAYQLTRAVAIGREYHIGAADCVR